MSPMGLFCSFMIPCFFLRASRYVVAIRGGHFSAIFNRCFLFCAHPQLINYFRDVELVVI